VAWIYSKDLLEKPLSKQKLFRFGHNPLNPFILGAFQNVSDSATLRCGLKFGQNCYFSQNVLTFEQYCCLLTNDSRLGRYCYFLPSLIYLDKIAALKSKLFICFKVLAAGGTVKLKTGGKP